MSRRPSGREICVTPGSASSARASLSPPFGSAAELLPGEVGGEFLAAAVDQSQRLFLGMHDHARADDRLEMRVVETGQERKHALDAGEFGRGESAMCAIENEGRAGAADWRQKDRDFVADARSAQELEGVAALPQFGRSPAGARM